MGALQALIVLHSFFCVTQLFLCYLDLCCVTQLFGMCNTEPKTVLRSLKLCNTEIRFVRHLYDVSKFHFDMHESPGTFHAVWAVAQGPHISFS